jgi:hypothetical protein
MAHRLITDVSEEPAGEREEVLPIFVRYLPGESDSHPKQQ